MLNNANALFFFCGSRLTCFVPIQTFAALVSLTNVFLLLVTVGKLTRNVVWGNLAFDGKSLLSRIALAFSALGILGILVLLGLVPWRLTWGWQGTREDLHYVYGCEIVLLAMMLRNVH